MRHREAGETVAMADVTLGELLGRVEEFETQLAQFYTELRDQSEDNNVRLLTYYLSRNRRRKQQVVDDVDVNSLDQIRATPVHEGSPFVPGEEFGALRAQPRGVNGGDLLSAAMAHSERILRYYGALLRAPLDMDAMVLLQDLVRVEESDLAVLRKMTAMRYFR